MPAPSVDVLSLCPPPPPKGSELLAVKELAETGRLSLDGLVTHHEQPEHADAAVEVRRLGAFESL